MIERILITVIVIIVGIVIHHEYENETLKKFFMQLNDDNLTSKVICNTTKGEFVIDVYRAWAPIGADRFIDLVKNNFYTDIAFFRCVEGFLTQFGISDKEDMQHWHNENILDDDIKKKRNIHKNYISFAGTEENSRSTQLIIAFDYLLGNEPWKVREHHMSYQL
jgi:cyclophilin family peptidyl-prolyl cis-trans isomerase